MATFNSANGSYQSGNKTLFETQMLAISNGHVVDVDNRLPVDIGNTSISISGNVNVNTPNVITVNSSPTDPVHVHLTEVGNSGILTVSYLPVGGNVYVNNFPTSFAVTQNTSPWIVSGNITTTPASGLTDAFGRQRTSAPYTLFDGFNRYQDNGQFNYANSVGGTHGFSSNTSSVDYTVTTANGAYVYAESKRVFAYQPGKSLQVLQTFVMNPSQTNLRQRIGYFSANNGYYLERSDDVYFVERTSVTGVVTETKKKKSTDWNIDKLDGTGPSGINGLNLDDPQILFMDIEWLGAGSVRMGFVINGQFIYCHRFDHANIDSAPKGAYMQTACLPLRSEIENTGTTSASSTFKRICSTIISEGGYELNGRPKTIAINPVGANTFECVTQGIYYPVLSIRLNPAYIDGIAIPKQIDVMPINSANYGWKIVKDAAITGAVWANVSSDSIVQYNTNTAASMSGGTDLNSGYVTSTVQGGGSFSATDGIFKYQLERNSFTNTTATFTLAVAASANTSNVAAAVLWEELT